LGATKNSESARMTARFGAQFAAETSTAKERSKPHRPIGRAQRRMIGCALSLDSAAPTAANGRPRMISGGSRQPVCESKFFCGKHGA